MNQRDNLSSDPFGVDIAELIEEHGRGNRRVSLDRCAFNFARSLEAQGLDVFVCMQGTPNCWRKISEEIACLSQAMAASEPSIKPGVTESELFAIMYCAVIGRVPLADTAAVAVPPSRAGGSACLA